MQRVKFGLKNPDLVLAWDIYHGYMQPQKLQAFTMVTNVGARSPKALQK